uniref:Uncharacterized protein n=1 Tax=Bionectria ochroleuca TaxID=29856 RepID=A0A8H7K1D5_BIOOC
MPRQKDTATTVTAWLGAPPVAADGFAFANGDFFAEASGQNRHRRATLGELKEHFSSGSDKDHPAHWFEAQLIHYGLRPSKTKSVARMRLYDAVNTGELTVPTHLASLESNLRKEWAKNNRETKKGSKTAAASETKKKPTTAATQKATGTKRKVNDNTDAAPTSGASTPHGTKRTKTATSKDKSSPKASYSAKNSTGSKATPTTLASTSRRGGISRGSRRGVSRTASSSVHSRAVRRGGVSQGPGRGVLATVSSSASSSRPIQTARCSAPLRSSQSNPSSQIRAGRHDDDSNTFGNYIRYDFDDVNDDFDGANGNDHSDNDDPPPPYSESEHDEETCGENITLTPLSYVKGRYAITCPYVAENYPLYGSDYVLLFDISGSSLWASFDLGVVQGVMYFPNSPRQLSYDPVPFK